MEINKSYTIDRFKVERLLSRSNHSNIYLARDTSLNRRVAIKFLTDKSIKKDDRFNQAMQEARAVSRLQHPNIISLYETGEYRSTPYLVFEYLEGMTLREIIKKQKPFSVQDAVKIMSHILGGISHAHQHGIIHNDLKPENILISNQGVPRIMDFGISKIVNEGPDAGQLQKGTLHYMAPECFSDGIIDKYSDIYSLGLIFYEMLTFSPCIEAENEFTLIYKIVYEPAVLPSLANPAVDSSLDNIFKKAVQKDPEARFRDGSSMKQAIDAYLESGKNNSESLSLKNDTDGVLNFLLRRMKYKSDFPAFSKSVIDINEKTTKNPYTSAKDLANIILKDYSLTNKLLKMVNSAFYGGIGKGVTSIHQAVVILGLEQVRMIASAMLVFTQIQNKTNIDELKDSMIKSFMSGLIAIEVANHLKMPKTEIGFLCAMFQNLGRNLTVYYFPEEYADIKALMEKENLGIQKAAREVLGVSFDELGVSVARHWKFPENIIYGMRSLPEGIIEKPKSKLEIIRNFSVFSVELCEFAGNAGSGQGSEQLEQLIERFKHGISISEKGIIKILLNSIEKMKKYILVLEISPEKSPFIKSIFNLSDAEEKSEESVDNEELSNAASPQVQTNDNYDEKVESENKPESVQNTTEEKPVSFQKKLIKLFKKNSDDR